MTKPHHELPATATTAGGTCDTCRLPIRWGEPYVVRGVRRKLRWHVACDPSPRCPLCGVRTDDAWGCIIHRATAWVMHGLAYALSSVYFRPPNEDEVRHLFRKGAEPVPERGMTWRND